MHRKFIKQPLGLSFLNHKAAYGVCRRRPAPAALTKEQLFQHLNQPSHLSPKMPS